MIILPSRTVQVNTASNEVSQSSTSLGKQMVKSSKNVCCGCDAGHMVVQFECPPTKMGNCRVKLQKQHTTCYSNISCMVKFSPNTDWYFIVVIHKIILLAVCNVYSFLLAILLFQQIFELKASFNENSFELQYI